MRRTRPSEVALLLRLVQPACRSIGIGSLVALGLGIWLADDAGYGIGEGWVVAAIVLWAVARRTRRAGRHDARASARELAEQLAEDGDQPSAELRRAVRDRRAFVLNYASFAR